MDQDSINATRGDGSMDQFGFEWRAPCAVAILPGQSLQIDGAGSAGGKREAGGKTEKILRQIISRERRGSGGDLEQPREASVVLDVPLEELFNVFVVAEELRFVGEHALGGGFVDLNLLNVR